MTQHYASYSWPASATRYLYSCLDSFGGDPAVPAGGSWGLELAASGGAGDSAVRGVCVHLSFSMVFVPGDAAGDVGFFASGADPPFCGGGGGRGLGFGCEGAAAGGV